MHAHDQGALPDWTSEDHTMEEDTQPHYHKKTMESTESNLTHLWVAYDIAAPDQVSYNAEDTLFSYDWYHNYNGSYFPPIQLEFPVEAQIALIAVFSLTALMSVIGNILVLIVLSLGTRSKTDLSKYLLNLAIADLCMACFCIPFTFTKSMLGYWVFGSDMCPLVLFMQVLSVAVSIFTNTAIGIDR